MVTSRAARVDIAGPEEALRLPVSQVDGTSRETYVRWLLERLDLPRLEVPSAPTKPESEPTPVSLQDYLLYCTLPQDEIGFAVCGHRDPFKNIKRKYVFEILYGMYSIEIARLQDELRDVQAKLRELRSQDALFTRFLDETAWENRAVIQQKLEAAHAEVQELESLAVLKAQQSGAATRTEALRRRVVDLEASIQELQAEIEGEKQSRSNLERLASQLESQIERITRSIVAQRHLGNIEFIICPRCSSPVGADRAKGDECYLCLQRAEPQLSRQDLIAEGSRAEAQLAEAQELLEERRKRLIEREKVLAAKRAESAEVRHELDFQSRAFVSSEASSIAEVAERRARAMTNIARLQDYVRVYDKIDETRRWAAELDQRKAELESALDAAGGETAEAYRRIGHLEREFNGILERFHPPAFGEEQVSGIDRQTFLPLFRGRRFDELSSPGLASLVNIAHALAHQRTSLALGLRLPTILFIDGLSEHLGEEGLDPERVEGIYNYLIETSTQIGDALQMIVIDNEVPARAREFVRLELTEGERLIPSG